MFWLLLLRSAVSLVTVVEGKLLPWAVPVLWALLWTSGSGAYWGVGSWLPPVLCC